MPISKNTKTLLYSILLRIRLEEGFCVFRNGLYSKKNRLEEGFWVFRNGLILVNDLAFVYIYMGMGSLYGSPRFLCRLTALIKLLVAVQRQRVIYKETIEFASPAIGSAHFHVSWLSDFIFYHKHYINRFTNHFSIHS